jgi:hypothetical protein
VLGLIDLFELLIAEDEDLLLEFDEGVLEIVVVLP